MAISGEEFEQALKRVVAKQAGIPEAEVNDDTPVKDPCILTLFLSMELKGISVACSEPGSVTSFGTAKRSFVAYD
jgi:hypothetical protein